MKDEQLHSHYDVKKFANEKRLVFPNWMVHDQTGDFSRVTAKSLLKDFDWTRREQLPVLPEADGLSTVKSKKNAGRAKTLQSSEPARCSNSLNTHKVESRDGVDK